MPDQFKPQEDETAATDWVDETIPRSAQFDDTYYSKAGGLSESRHVFLDGNWLSDRFATASGEFVIAELGFGTGLNFLAALELWKRSAPQDATLRFISFERYPLSLADMERALSRWPELEAEIAPFLEAYTCQTERLEFGNGNLHLTVEMRDANSGLPQMDFLADAWFLDGFAPSRNPELWNAELMAEVCRHTKPGGSFATYTAAGWVRRNLQAAGFHVSKKPGFGGKREMMAGNLPQTDQS
ncbi:MAG: tRNA (5-methylaminomethyl-2-thiouridine)(34)-methyltransferase MnmD [Nitratireductor sp.]|nr:tRNA (5-methylaminomethyl-2-thiouridine)(34)-methyltransferase MnmD [Nitratireductor sp.]MCC0020831.1 tRNA (5-methylaminomethyl-2-thiouridine)(34)-methyltransferase MnmD [Nitratireductor sp.]